MPKFLLATFLSMALALSVFSWTGTQEVYAKDSGEVPVQQHLEMLYPTVLVAVGSGGSGSGTVIFSDIHEDEYLGTGTWKNQYDQDVSGWNRGGEDRYFASHSGLDKDSDEYKMRFRGLYPGWEEGQSWGGISSDKVLKDIKERGYGSGKDYAYYG